MCKMCTAHEYEDQLHDGDEQEKQLTCRELLALGRDVVSYYDYLLGDSNNSTKGKPAAA